MRQNKYEYDAFISHAVEDKIPIANELCAKLERAGLKIWYSGKELGVGDSIEKTIERGLNRSRYGIVIFSPTYLAKNWTIREFYTLLAKEIEEQKVILPVLYNITLDELKNKDMVMADRFAVNSDRGLDFVADRLVGEIRRSHVVKRKQAWFSKIWLILVLSLLANVTLLVKGTDFSGQPPSLHHSIPVGSDELYPPGANHRTLLGEMQGIFRKINTCGCSTAEKTAHAPVYRAEAAHFKSSAGGDPVAYEHRGAPQIADHHRQGSKVTMAVVFQIETPGHTGPGLEQEVDEILNTIKPREEPDPFTKVVSLNRSGDQYVGAACNHTRNQGD